MIIRAGIAFPLDPELAEQELEKEVKARGIGKKILKDHRNEVLALWAEKPGETYHLSRTMFYGMKTSTDPPSKARPYPTRRANYGTWADQPQIVSYDPFPKRPRQRIDSGMPLRTWAFGKEQKSAAYQRLMRGAVAKGAVASDGPEALDERLRKDLLGEQPDAEDEVRDFRI